MVNEINFLLREKLFLIGLVIKVVFIIFFIPEIQIELFQPFFEFNSNYFSFDPWTSYLASGGSVKAFPYGPIMYYLIMPFAVIFGFFDSGDSSYFLGLGIRVTILIFDFLTLLFLIKIFHNIKRFLWVFWLSPIIIFVSYWHGQLDLIPVSILLGSLLFIKEGNYKISGFLFGIAVATKHSILIVFPVLAIFLYFSRNVNDKTKEFFLAFFSVIAFESLFLLSEGFVEMTMLTNEALKIFSLVIEIGRSSSIYIVPVLYVMLLHFIWRFRRMNFDLLSASIGLAFSLVVVLSPSPPGWFIWLLPFFIAHNLKNHKSDMLLHISSILFILFFITTTPKPETLLDSVNLKKFLDLITLNTNYVSIIYSLLTGILGLLLFQIIRDSIRLNTSYQFGRKPITIGFASTNNKIGDKFKNSLPFLFGENSTLEISSKYYCLHGECEANKSFNNKNYLNSIRLFDLMVDLRNLLSGKKVGVLKHPGLKLSNTRIQKEHSIIIVEGVEALLNTQVLEQINKTFFIDVESKSSQLFIEQFNHADISLILKKINPNLSLDSTTNQKILIKIKKGLYYQELIKALVGVAGLEFKLLDEKNSGEVYLEIYGHLDKESALIILKKLAPNLLELINYRKYIQDGAVGLFQLVFLIEVDEFLLSINNDQN